MRLTWQGHVERKDKARLAKMIWDVDLNNGIGKTSRKAKFKIDGRRQCCYKGIRCHELEGEGFKYNGMEKFYKEVMV